MTLKKLISRIESKEINIKDKDDIAQIKKYFHDLPKTINKSLCQKIIKYWDTTKMKVSDEYGLDIISRFLDIKGECSIQKITVVGKYDFSYVVYTGNKIRQENIFKFNFRNIVKELNKYFTNTKILIEFEKATTIDKKIKKPQATYKHDVIIKIISKDIDENDIDENDIDENTYEIVLEYFEKVHNKFNDDDKKISTDLFSDGYYVFCEKNDNMKEFMISTIYSIIELICASMNDPYELSKILHFNKNYKSKSYNKNISYFNKIVEIKKLDDFDFTELYNKMTPTDPDTGDEFTKEEFLDYLKTKYKLDVNVNVDLDADATKFNAELFESIIIMCDENIDSNAYLTHYKIIYMETMNTLFSASQKIIDIMTKQRKKRLQLPEFIKNIQKFHKDNLKNEFY